MEKKRRFITISFAVALCGITFSAFAEEPKDVRRGSNSVSETTAAGGKSSSDSKAATAQTPRAKSEPENKKKTQAATRTTPSPKKVGKVKPKSEASTQGNRAQDRFVDRDGDGLRDGKEHRFRGRYRRDKAGGREATSPQRVVRLRQRYGATGDTPQRGSQGRRGQ